MDTIIVNVTETVDEINVNVSQGLAYVATDGVTTTGRGTPDDPIVAVAGSGDMAKAVYDPGNISGNAFDYNNFINTPPIPVNTSDLINDSGFITSASIPTLISQLTNDVGFITSAAVASGYVPLSRTVNGHALSSNISISKTDVGLGSVADVAQIPLSYLDTDTALTANSDIKVASQKAVKTYADTKQTALGYTPENIANKNIASGYAGLDSGGLIPSSLLPSFVDDVLEYNNLAAFPVTGETGKIYVAKDTNKTYRWSGSVYVEISASPGSTDSVTEGSVNLYFTNARAIAATLTGYSAGAGAVSASDSILSAIQKLSGNISALTTGVSSVNGLTGAVALTGTSNRLTISGANVFDISASYVGQSSITTLGTISTGVWNGTAIGDSYISSAATWNAKQAALSGTGFIKISGTTISYDNSIYLTTSDAASTYQPLDSDLTAIAGLTATTDNFIVAVSSAWASRTPAQVKTTLSLNNVENTALSTWAGTTNINTVGTISSGTWSASTIAINKGGTGQITASAAFDALAPSQTGNSGKFLTTNGTTTSWATVSSPSAADPSASIGLSAVNGSASSFMRSDAAPALSQTIAPTWTAQHIFQTTALGTTQDSTKSIQFKNNTAAAAGAQQISMATEWIGNGWKTTATAASQVTKFGAWVTPVQGAANPTSYLGFYSSINGASYGATPVLTITSDGNVGINTATPNSSYKLDVNGGINSGTGPYRMANTTCGMSYDGGALLLEGSSGLGENVETKSYGRHLLYIRNSNGTRFSFSSISTDNNVMYINAFNAAGVSVTGSQWASIEQNAGKLIFSANNNTSTTPNQIMTVYGNNSNVGIGTTTPVASAALEISSTTQGLLLPRMTTTQKNAISSPAGGLAVFDTSLAKMCFYNGAAWETVTSL